MTVAGLRPAETLLCNNRAFLGCYLEVTKYFFITALITFRY